MGGFSREVIECRVCNPIDAMKSGTVSQPEPLAPSCEAACDAKREDGPC